MEEKTKNGKDFKDIDNVIDDTLDEDKNSGEVLTKKQWKKRNKKYLILSVIVGIFIIFSLIALYFLFSYNKYYSLNLKEKTLNQKEKSFIKETDELNSMIKNKKNFLLRSFGFDVGNNFSSENNSREVSLDKTNQFKSYLENSSISFVEKKKELRKNLKTKISDISKTNQRISKLESNIGEYGFLPETVDEILLDSSIQRTIKSVETIKFFTALKIFSYFDSFIKSFVDAHEVKGSINKMREKMEYYKDRGENDTFRYIEKCYLNPYLYCNDFGNYYDSDDDLQDSSDFDVSLFIKLLDYIEKKLENEVFPKLNIVLNSMDPKSNKISFTININTYEEDQKSLQSRKDGIINPHIFITSTLIDLLRGSHYIIGDTISIDTFEKDKKEIEKGGVQKTVYTSNFSFDVPIQKSVEREIYDFIYSN